VNPRTYLPDDLQDRLLPPAAQFLLYLDRQDGGPYPQLLGRQSVQLHALCGMEVVPGTLDILLVSRRLGPLEEMLRVFCPREVGLVAGLALGDAVLKLDAEGTD